MRCEWCHGRMFRDGFPCTHCMGGITNCCDGVYCESDDLYRPTKEDTDSIPNPMGPSSNDGAAEDASTWNKGA